MAISETWLNINIENRLTTIPGYNFIRADRETKKGDGNTKKGGGLGVYYTDKLEMDPNKFKQLNISNQVVEAQWLVLSRPNTKKILIGNIYRPPNGSIEEAFEQIGDKLDQMEDLNKYETLLIGDFNADYLNKKGQPYKQIKKFEAEHQVQQLIQEPTRYTSKGQTAIDLAFSNIKHCNQAGVLNYNISDHKAIYIIKKKERNCKATEVRLGRSYRRLNKEKLIQVISEIDQRRLIELTEPNRYWEELEKIITEAADKICPIKELRMRIHTVKYLNRELLELQRDRDYFAEKADKTKELGDAFIAKCLTDITKAEVDRAREQYHKTEAENLNQNQKKYWDNVEEVEPKAQASINGIVDEQTGERIPDSKLPEKINTFFSEIGAKLALKYETIETNEKTFIPKQNETEYDIENVTEKEILKLITKIPTKKASGLKNLSAEFITMSMTVMIKQFTHLYNMIIDQGIYPDAWKIAIVTPIPKVAHPKTCSDLRPISILPLPGRIMEKIMGGGMSDHLEETDYLPEQQNGFRKNRSTTRAVATLIDEIAQGMDEGLVAVTLFIDFQKAFDTVDHEILMWKLKKAGMGVKICKLMTSYLANRKQRTKLNNITSSCKPVNTGVPQGSTLAPLLYTIFSSDLPEISKAILFTIFADDTAMTIIEREIKKAAERMNQVMPLAMRWFEENKLTVNVKKTEYMVFGSKSKLAKSEPIKIMMGDQELRRVDSYKYLGTTLDPNLNATKQLSKLNQQMAQKLISFRRLRACLSEETAIIIYKATILPIFDYNDIFYNMLNKQQLTKIQRLQNRALRLVFKGKIMSVAEMHERANVEYLEERRENHLLSLMYNRAKDDNYIDNTTRKTRMADAVVLKVPKARTNKLKKAPIYKGSVLWNNLPPRIRQAKTRLELKNLNKMHKNGQPLNWREGQVTESEEINESIIIVE